MKKSMIMALAAALVLATACNDSKKTAQPAPASQPTEITDSAFQAAAAGAYKSYDGKKTITINSDFTVKTENFDKEYYKWAFLTDPKGVNAATVSLIRKGLDADVEEQATLDTQDGTLLIKNETFRKETKK